MLLPFVHLVNVHFFFKFMVLSYIMVFAWLLISSFMCLLMALFLIFWGFCKQDPDNIDRCLDLTQFCKYGYLHTVEPANPRNACCVCACCVMVKDTSELIFWSHHLFRLSFVAVDISCCYNPNSLFHRTGIPNLWASA